MKRGWSWSAVVESAGVTAVSLLCGIGGLAATADAKQTSQPAASAKSADSSQGAAQKVGDEKVVFTFDDEAKMSEFTKLWQQRQAIILRMAVLQAYWNQEQPTLTKLNEKITADYKLDVKKNYSLDVKKRSLIELPSPPAPEPSAAPGTSISAATAPQATTATQ